MKNTLTFLALVLTISFSSLASGGEFERRREINEQCYQQEQREHMAVVDGYLHSLLGSALANSVNRPGAAVSKRGKEFFINGGEIVCAKSPYSNGYICLDGAGRAVGGLNSKTTDRIFKQAYFGRGENRAPSRCR